MDKAQILIDLVIRKGCQACQKFIMHLHGKDPKRAQKLRLL